MAYVIYLDDVALPVTPSKIQTKITNQNKTIHLINEGEVNILKSPGLREVSFSAMIPHVEYPFAYYPDGFKDANFYLEKFSEMKKGKKPIRLYIRRKSPLGKKLFNDYFKVSIEDYSIDEDASEGQSLTISMLLKEYKDYCTPKPLKIDATTNEATLESNRPAETAPIIKTYTVKSGDTLFNISKKYLGDGNRYPEIYNLNKGIIKNPNIILVGQVLTMPS